MKSCSSCARPLLPIANACPFCGVRLSAKWIALAGATVATPFVLSACYGQPPCSGDDLNDDDSDGYTECFDDGGFDCDDTDPAVNIDAMEVCDDSIDNDCDGAIDAEDMDCDSDADSDTEADSDTDSGSGA